MYQEIKACRLCGYTGLIKVLDLGMQALTGIFPKSRDEDVPAGPLELYKCESCDLVQLGHNYDLSKLYGNNYGYRSGLNQSMVRHLHQKVRDILKRVELMQGDLILDIGSNDSTLLQAYPDSGFTLVGIDPSGPKFKKYYPDHIQLISEFFHSNLLQEHFPERRAKIITSIAMFYDLERPMEFVLDVMNALSDDGVWVFEQSYLPFMLKSNSYDTVCHEHLEYYALKQIKIMMDQAGLKILDVEFNDINGGSFSVMVAKKTSNYSEATELVNKILHEEQEEGFSELHIYDAFRTRIMTHSKELKGLLRSLRQRGEKVLGYGASTKGNVLIQFSRLDSDDVPFIAEVNEDKFHAFTPGSRLPIISEEEARQMKPHYFLVFPWHFRNTIIGRERDFLASGGKLIFPLPNIEIVSSSGVSSL